MFWLLLLAIKTRVTRYVVAKGEDDYFVMVKLPGTFSRQTCCLCILVPSLANV